MDANRFFKIGVGSLAIAIAVYIVYLMVAPLVISYYVMNKADEMTNSVHNTEKKEYITSGIDPIVESSSEETEQH